MRDGIESCKWISGLPAFNELLGSVLAAAVVGIRRHAIAVLVCHKAELDSGSVIHHVVATDGQRIHTPQSTGLRLGRLRTHGLTRARVGGHT